jgi:hypothetical protein
MSGLLDISAWIKGFTALTKKSGVLFLYAFLRLNDDFYVHILSSVETFLSMLLDYLKIIYILRRQFSIIHSQLSILHSQFSIINYIASCSRFFRVNHHRGQAFFIISKLISYGREKKDHCRIV